MLLVFGGLIVELVVYTKLGWRFRRALVFFVLALTLIGIGLEVEDWAVLTLTVPVVLYRFFNLGRILKARMHENYLRQVAFKTSWILVLMQLIVLGLWFAWLKFGSFWSWELLAAVQLVVAATLLAGTIRGFKKTAWPGKTQNYSDNELPTLSVAIPARNETEDLQACLQSLIASDYPKLEILVLDDCSQERRTPEIIRSFAQHGVRFIKGEEPGPTWLPKNHAYYHLAQEASGEFILFCDTDIRFEPDTLRKMMTFMLQRKKQMLCMLPQRVSDLKEHANLVQAMRYWWELVPPRRLFARPPVLNSCWVISAQSLKKFGGFKAVTRSITPEAHFARNLLPADEYSFMRSGKSPGVWSSKTAAEQRTAALRTRYPQLHRRPELVLMASIFEAMFLILPFLLAIAGFWLPTGLGAHVLSGLAAAMLVVSYQILAFSTRKTNGTGLGLYVTLKLAHLLHAEIDVKSELNKGSTFSIFIPNL